MFSLVVLLVPAASALVLRDPQSDAHRPENKTCSEMQYTCADGRCIPKSWVCDNEPDCTFGEDELNCVETKCMFNQFKCDASSCIPDTWVCDGQADCANQADEANCTMTCGPDKFVCKSNNFCIQKVWLCDGDNDCGDNSDEEDCARNKCQENEFACDRNSCISLNWRCDGDYDCQDDTDEMGCPRTDRQKVCRMNEYLCEDRQTCIPSSWLCDGDSDCPGSDDENQDGCRLLRDCREDEFMCRDSKCINGDLYCNGVVDCTDKSDEDNCTAPVKSCGQDEFDCGGNMCITLSKVCDGHPDCPDGEDEPSRKCHVNECLIVNGGCSHKCIDTPTSYYCSCNHGFKLVHNYSCEDINECDYPGSCSHICLNEFGSYKCECFEGYTKDPYDRTKCKPTVGHTHLLFTKKHDIRKLSMDRHQEMSLLVNDTKHSAALNYMFKTGMIYWSDLDDHKIYKAPIGDYTRSVFIGKDIDSCDGLAVDWVYDRIYWTDTGKDTIEVANLDGTMRKTLFDSNLDEPRAIVVNPLDGWLYWSDWGEEARIERAGMDGSHRQVIVSYDIKWPNGLALDLARQKLYWLDAKLHSISSVNYDGSGRSVILKSADVFHHPYSISVFEDYMYWTDWEKHSIFKANKFNGQNVTSVTGDRKVLNLMVVHAYHPYMQPNGTNHCVHSEVKCSHLCFPFPQINENAPKISCGCPDGYALASNGLTCTAEGPATPHPNSAFHSLKTLTPSAQSSAPANYGPAATIVFLSVLVFLVFASTVAFIFYRNYVRKSTTSINFDNPVYRKTTEDKFALVQAYPQSSYIEDSTDDMQEPLTRNENDYI